MIDLWHIIFVSCRLKLNKLLKDIVHIVFNDSKLHILLG